MKSETPREVAERVVEQNLPSRSLTHNAQLIADVEAALDAERERCAKIAETHEGHGAWCSSGAGDCQSLTVKAIAAAIRNGREPQDWRPIETAPKDGTYVLLWYPYWSSRPMVANWERDGSHWRSEHILSWYQDDDPGPTHWMPLPLFEVITNAE